MQIEIKEATFKPVTITLDTPEEVTAFYTMLNFTPILDALDINEEADLFRRTVGLGYSDHALFDKLCEALK